MPGLTVATDAPLERNGANADNSRPSSPTRPPISPITPVLGPTGLPELPTDLSPPPPAFPFAQGRPALRHSQPDQVGVPPPALISFDDDNPDVLALKSAISILQLQRAKATRDAQQLARVKADALADPAAFIADLQAGRVAAEDDSLFPSGRGARPRRGRAVRSGDGDGDDVEMADDDDDDDEDDDDDHDESGEDDTSGAGTEGSKSASGPQQQGNTATGGERSWHTLPKPQNVVRCPPINWAQYGIVGESLDKLHAEQQRAPAQGSPAFVTPSGSFEFQGGVHPGGPGEPLVGIAAPYMPGRDKIAKKVKSGKK